MPELDVKTAVSGNGRLVKPIPRALHFHIKLRQASVAVEASMEHQMIKALPSSCAVRRSKCLDYSHHVGVITTLITDVLSYVHYKSRSETVSSLCDVKNAMSGNGRLKKPIQGSLFLIFQVMHAALH